MAQIHIFVRAKTTPFNKGLVSKKSTTSHDSHKLHQISSLYICNPPIYDMTRRLPIIFYTFQPNSVCFWKMCRRFVQPNQKRWDYNICIVPWLQVCRFPGEEPSYMSVDARGNTILYIVPQTHQKKYSTSNTVTHHRQSLKLLSKSVNILNNGNLPGWLTYAEKCVYIVLGVLCMLVE